MTYVTYYQQAKRLIELYVEGSDLTEDQEHLIHNTADEHCQILDNVVETQFFFNALLENIDALGGINQDDLR